MRFDDALPIIEGKLYAWAEWRQRSNRPAAAISSIYRGDVGRTETPDHTSQQERWVMQQAQVYEAGVIERALRHCSQEQRELVFRRYVQRESWGEIADGLHVGERTAYRIRDQALAVVASALGIWNEPTG
jgi:DNA-directed RNA polymerase specialized sigma24 family protein